jgi:iron complex transport system permease protein
LALSADVAALGQARQTSSALSEMAVLSGLALSVVVLGFWAATIGPAGIGFLDAVRAVSAWLAPGSFDVPKMTHTVVVNIRLPRILMADLAGFGLGISGFAMQAVLRNPLASPYTLGISAAAGFGASLAIVLGIGILSSQYMVVGNAFLFALIASGLVLTMSVRDSSGPETVILTGVAMMFLFSAGITLLQYLGDPYAVQSVVFWLIGDVGRASWSKLALLGAVLGLTTPFLVFKAWDIAILRFGDDTAASLGVRVGWTRIGVMGACSLTTACLVSFVGTIAFVGLVAPHIVKLAGQTREWFGLLASGFVGAILLAAADMIALTALKPNVLPIGVITAFLGVPLFLFLIRRGRRL